MTGRWRPFLSPVGHAARLPPAPTITMWGSASSRGPVLASLAIRLREPLVYLNESGPPLGGAPPWRPGARAQAPHSQDAITARMGRPWARHAALSLANCTEDRAT